MKIAKITTDDGQTYYINTNHPNFVPALVKAEGPMTLVILNLTLEQYRSIPATSDAARFFELYK